MITVNDKRIEYDPEMTVASLLKTLNYVFPMLVVRKNGKLIPRNHYDSVTVEDEDQLDIIHLISGG